MCEGGYMAVNEEMRGRMIRCKCELCTREMGRKTAYWVLAEKGTTPDGFVLPKGMSIEEYHNLIIRDVMAATAIPKPTPEDP